MKSVCDSSLCCGCGVCSIVCSREAISIKDNIRNTTAEINQDLCVNCNLCSKVCPVLNPVPVLSTKRWSQGWARDKRIRSNSSSGGLAFALSEAFIKQGGFVCSCIFLNGEFVFLLTDQVEELKKFQGSKYVKSNPIGIYKAIKKCITQDNKKVLFIGLPCQVAAVKNYIGIRYDEYLYTIDLICHGTPSAGLFKKYMIEHSINLFEVDEISFRSKHGFGISAGRKIESSGVMDRYTIGFLQSMYYTENCYTCQYAKGERVSDITLGDSWGTDMKDELDRGLSLILCQTPKGEQLLECCDAVLFHVDSKIATNSNHQLNAPSVKPDYYNQMMKELTEGCAVDRVVFKYEKEKSLKQLIRKILIKIKE